VTRPLPQRLALDAAPGALLKGFARAVPITHSAAHELSYLALIRQLPCLKCGLEDSSEAAHLRQQSAAHGKRGGIGKKPEDRWALPLCGGPQGCHAEQHKIGERVFWDGIGINPHLVCEKLYAQKGDVVAMRAVVLGAIAERGR